MHAIDIITHMGIGTVFGVSGACVRGMCSHTHHRLIVGAILIAVESTLAVALVG